MLKIEILTADEESETHRIIITDSNDRKCILQESITVPKLFFAQPSPDVPVQISMEMMKYLLPYFDNFARTGKMFLPTIDKEA